MIRPEIKRHFRHAAACRYLKALLLLRDCNAVLRRISVAQIPQRRHRIHQHQRRNYAQIEPLHTHPRRAFYNLNLLLRLFRPRGLFRRLPSRRFRKAHARKNYPRRRQHAEYAQNDRRRLLPRFEIGRCVIEKEHIRHIQKLRYAERRRRRVTFAPAAHGAARRQQHDCRKAVTLVHFRRKGEHHRTDKAGVPEIARRAFRAEKSDPRRDRHRRDYNIGQRRRKRRE